MLDHTPSIAFRHLPPNSARIGYATEGAPFISAQLSTDAVSGLRKLGQKQDCGSNIASKHTRKHEARPSLVKKKKRKKRGGKERKKERKKKKKKKKKEEEEEKTHFRLDSNDTGLL